MAKPVVIILIPAFNEEAKIANALHILKPIVRHELGGFTPVVTVINDGSTDRTEIIAKNAGAGVIKLQQNMGKAYAVMYGINHYAKTKPAAIMLVDADLWGIEGQILRKTIERSTHKVVPTMVQARSHEDNQPQDNYQTGGSGFRCFNSAAIEKLGALNLHHFERTRKDGAPGFGLEEFFINYMKLLPKHRLLTLPLKDGYFKVSAPWRNSQANYRMQNEEIPRAIAKMKKLLAQKRSAARKVRNRRNIFSQAK